MGDYKQLNRELIDTNRELKQALARSQMELVLKHAELMDQHRIRIESERDFRERLLSSWAQNCLSFAREIDPSVNFIELLAPNSSSQIVNSNVGICGHGDSTRSSRRSTQLVAEFRRYSAVCRPHSVMSVSPTRRQHEDNAIVEENEMDSVVDESGSDMELDNSIISEKNVIDVENDETNENEDLHCIREESEDEAEYEEVDVIHKTSATSNRQPIRDVTNFNVVQRDSKADIVNKRGKEQRRQHDSENSIELARDLDQDCTQTPTQYSIEIDIEEDLVNSMQRSMHVSRNICNTPDLTLRNVSENVGKQFQNENPKRHLVVRVQRLHEQPQIEVHIDNESSYDSIEQTVVQEDEQSMDSKRNNDEHMLGITEFSMGNFQEASCSTPCRSRVATTELIETTATLSSNLSAQTPCNSSRPSRRCAPRSLAEPSLRAKMRSDSRSASRKTKKR